MIVNATKNDFINHWCVNYDEFMQIKRDECDASLNLRRHSLKKKNAKTVLHVC